jgi:hypothetical protein
MNRRKAMAEPSDCLDTSAIAGMLGKRNEELVDSIRPEIWDRLEQLIARRGRRG